jgi:DNA-binding Lrp family transcriptional regulator
MVVIRKKKTIDGMDRAILRSIYDSRRSLSGATIARRVNLSPSAIAQRLINLKTKGIIIPTKITGVRTFKRTFQIKGIKKPVTRTIRAPRSIMWGINLKSKSRRK